MIIITVSDFLVAKWITVNAVAGGEFEVLLIPHTLAVTTWGEKKADDRVNIEVDQMARYAARLMEAQRV